MFFPNPVFLCFSLEWFKLLTYNLYSFSRMLLSSSSQYFITVFLLHNYSRKFNISFQARNFLFWATTFFLPVLHIFFMYFLFFHISTLVKAVLWSWSRCRIRNDLEHFGRNQILIHYSELIFGSRSRFWNIPITDQLSRGSKLEWVKSERRKKQELETFW